MIKASKAYYLKLGQGGAYEALCFADGTLRLNYREIPEVLARSGTKPQVRDYILKSGISTSPTAAANHASNLEIFFHPEPDALWVTFANGLLYWCFAEPEVSYLGLEHASTLGCFVRRSRGGWQSSDLQGRPLYIAELNGELTKVAAYQMTACKVKDKLVPYLVSKINGQQLAEVKRAKDTKDELIRLLAELIQMLSWKDFELLVDLIFSQSGWQRISSVGGTKKTVDLDLVLPTTGMRAFVQVKAETTQAQLDLYSERFSSYAPGELESSHQYFFVYHTSRRALRSPSARLALWGPEKVAEMALSSGLVDWIIRKVG